MKYALIGCGMICANHIRAALETGLEIVALCDLVEENREKALALIPEEKRGGVTLYADYRAMLAEQKPELTAIALGSGVKRQIVCDCLEAGSNVIVEKPIALSLEDADAMIAAARITVTPANASRPERESVASSVTAPSAAQIR